MDKKTPNYPSTYLEDLSPQEARKLMKVLRAPISNAIPGKWIGIAIGIGLFAVFIIGGFYGIR